MNEIKCKCGVVGGLMFNGEAYICATCVLDELSTARATIADKEKEIELRVEQGQAINRDKEIFKRAFRRAKFKLAQQEVTIQRLRDALKRVQKWLWGRSPANGARELSNAIDAALAQGTHNKPREDAPVCGNCGHPKHTDSNDHQCKICLAEYNRRERDCGNVCAAYQPDDGNPNTRLYWSKPVGEDAQKEDANG